VTLDVSWYEQFFQPIKIKTKKFGILAENFPEPGECEPDLYQAAKILPEPVKKFWHEPISKVYFIYCTFSGFSKL